MTYTMKVAGLERQLPLCKVSDEQIGRAHV